MVDETPRNSAGKTRGRPFEAGNPGKPKGARNRATRAAEALLDGESEGEVGAQIIAVANRLGDARR
jgi:hypothetical protein